MSSTPSLSDPALSEPAAEPRAETDPRRAIPPTSRLLEAREFAPSIQTYGSRAVTVQLREVLDDVRRALSEESGQPAESAESLTTAALAERVRGALAEQWGVPARRVINATGVFLHTNLGRAPLDHRVLDELPALLDAATDVELDLESGRRSDRNRRAARLLSGLVGSESALVVNNNAAALILILAELVGPPNRRREVLVSRGELVEIGGSFRIPDILRAAGCRLVEVGTTNRTRLADYRQAVGEHTGLLLKVHPSNYRVRGFTAEVTAAELVELGRDTDLPVVVDEGSGLLRPSERPQLRDHTSLSELIDAGVTLACGSGDKLLGGPQAGLVFGAASQIERLRRHPLYRALRPSRQILVSLEATLRLHLTEQRLPLDRLWDEAETLARSNRLQADLRAIGVEVDVTRAEAFVGGGAAPDAPIDGWALSLADDGSLARMLRQAPRPVMGYVKEGRLMLDLRTVDPGDEDHLHRTLAWALEQLGRHETDPEGCTTSGEPRDASSDASDDDGV